MVVINKADGDLLPSAKKAQSDYSTALHFLQSKSPFWKPSVSLCSATSKYLLKFNYLM